jgi:hypothetical protein
MIVAEVKLDPDNEDGCELIVGDWAAVIDAGGRVVVMAYEDDGIDTLYKWLGFEIHSQQQCQSRTYYKNYSVTVPTMEQTCGRALVADDIVEIGGVPRRLGDIVQDDNITWGGSNVL